MSEKAQLQQREFPFSGWRAYGTALGLVSVAFVLRAALEPLLRDVQPFAFFYLSVAFAAWWGGRGPALVAWGAGLVLATLFFLEPGPVTRSGVPMGVYTSVCAVMVALVEHARRAASDALESAGAERGAQSELARQNMLLAGLAESVLDAILLVSADGRILYANRRFIELWGFPPTVLTDDSEARALDWAATQVADPVVFREQVAAAYASGAVVRDELRMRDGRVYERFGGPVEHTGARSDWIWTLRDITRRKQDEQRLRESEDHLRHVLDNLYAFVAVLTPDGTITEVNRAPLEAAGLSAADALGKKLWDSPWWSWSEESRTRIRDACERASHGEIVRFDAMARMAGDARMWIDVQVAPLRDAEGRITHLVPSGMDITARRWAELALSESEQRFHRAFADAPVGMALTALDGRLEAVNRAYCELTGYTEAELLGGGNFLMLTHEADVARNEAVLQRLLASEIPAFHVEKRYIRKDGRVVWVRASASLRRDPQGRPFQLIGIVEDIDERKRAEESLRQATTLLSAISDTTGDVIFAKDLQGRLTFANPATLALVGKPLELALGRTDAELLGDTEAVRIVMRNDRRVMDSGVAEDLEEEVPRPDGRRTVWYSRKVPYRDGEGRVIGVLGVSRDITLRKEAQERLQHSERQYRELARVLDAERSKLSAIIDNLPVGLVIGDITGETLFLNKAGLRVHGFSAEEEKFDTFERYAADFELRDPGGRLLPIDEWPAPRALRGDYVRGFEVWLHNRRSGTDRYVVFDAVPVHTSEGEPSVVVYVILDLTDQKRAEDALRESEARFRAMADNIPQLAWMAAADGEIFWFNRRWTDYTGLDVDDMRRIGWSAVHHPDTSGSVFAGWMRAVKAGEPWEDTFQLRGKDGTFRWFLARAFPIRGPDGAITRWFGTKTDITEQKQVEEALARAKDELAEHSANLEKMVAQRTRELTETVHELEAFSYSLSHDMRAPLRAMKGFSQILEADYGSQLGPEAAMYLGKISRAAGRLDQLIQDVLTYSRIVGEPIQLQPIDVERLAHQLVDENPALQPPRAEVTIDSPLHPVLGHEAYLMQVLSNLVYNAVKFVEPGHTAHVHIWTEVRDGEVRLSVRDDGIGIAPEAQERIFGMFQRMHSERAYEGTGIGLTIVRKAVERMGGRVEVESAPGRGSTFSVELRRP